MRLATDKRTADDEMPTAEEVALLRAAKYGNAPAAVTVPVGETTEMNAPVAADTQQQDIDDDDDAPEDEDADDKPAGGEDEESEEEDEPTEGADDDSLIDENGKYLGKYDSPEALAKAYKEAQKLIGKKGESERKLKLQLQEAGYTFDVDGNPVAPKGATQQAQQQVQTQQSTLPEGWTIAENGNRVNPDGVQFDYLDMPVISDEEWREQYYEDPIAYDNMRRDYFATRDRNLAAYNARQQQAMAVHREALIQKAKTEYNLPDEIVQQVMADVDGAMPYAHESLRTNPAALDLVMRASAFERTKAYYEQREQQILAGNADALKSGKRVVAFETSTVNGNGNGNGSNGTYGLTKAELAMAKSLKISPKDYAENK